MRALGVSRGGAGGPVAAVPPAPRRSGSRAAPTGALPSRAAINYPETSQLSGPQGWKP